MINKNFKKVNKLISFIDTKILLILSIVTIVSLFVLKISWAGCSVSNYNVTISDSGPSAHSYIAHSNITLEGGTNGCNLWEAWFNGYSSPSSDWKYGCMEQKSFSGFAATICKGLSYGPTCYGSCQCSSDGRIWKGGCYEPGEEITFTLTDLSGMHIGTVPINITAIAYIPGAEKICYQDADNDGYGNPVSSQKFNGGSCPSGWVSDNTDCDDTNENIDDTSTTWHITVCGSEQVNCQKGVWEEFTVPEPAVLGVSHYSQGMNTPWAGEQYNDMEGYTIQQKGCTLCCASMILAFYGFDYNPKYLNQQPIYDRTHGVLFPSVAALSPHLKYYGRIKENIDDFILNSVCNNIPLIARVERSNGREHSVVINGLWGMTQKGKPNWSIIDPGNAKNINMEEAVLNGSSYDKILYVSPIYFSGGLEPFSNAGFISIMARSPLELCVIDPQGSRLGIDSSTGYEIKEISNAVYYYTQNTDPNLPDYKLIEIPEPIEGKYIIQLIGTGIGSYHLDIYQYDKLGNLADEKNYSGEIASEEIINYEINYSSTPIFYKDADEDGYGDPNVIFIGDDKPEKFVVNKGDCNDNDPNINPEAEEIFDGIDNNCNGEVDENFDLLTDPNNCGTFSYICPSYPHAEAICCNGQCIMGSCEAGWKDLDGDPNNGCEYEVPVWHVDINGGKDFQSIYKAINSANNGEIITVHPGIYFENINFSGKAITLRSLDPNDPNIVASTIIDGNNNGSVVSFKHWENKNSILCGITLRNGFNDNGGGIYCRQASPTILKCNIENNEANYDGGGVYYDLSSNIKNIDTQPYLKDCIIIGNKANNGSGGGIHCRYASAAIKNCIITDNEAKYDGGGIFYGWAFNLNTQPNIEGCSIARNKALNGSGGGIYSTYSPANIKNCVITNNETKYDGGGIFYGWCSYFIIQPKIINCNINQNIAGGSGGAICCRESSPSILNNVIYNNTATWGGGIHCGWCLYSDIQPQCTNCTICKNLAYNDGGGIYSVESSPTITNCIIWDNSPDEIFSHNNTAIVNYSDIRGGYYGPGIGNISVNPLFVDPNNENFHLEPSSDCFNAGNIEFSPDMGAYTVISDTKPPEIICPSDINVFATGDLTEVDYSAKVIDNLDPYPTITYDPPPKSLFPLGTTPVTIIANDEQGNINYCTFNIAVQEGCYLDQNTTNTQTEKEFNLQVVFYDVTTCYVADICNEGDTCSELTDYKDSSKVIMTFKDGTLRTMDKRRADGYGYGTEHGLKKCASSHFSFEAKEILKGYVQEVCNLIYSWSGNRMKIVPHFHSIMAEMGSGIINKNENSLTGYEGGQNPSPEQFIYFGKKAGVDLYNMDLFVAFTNPFPETGSENDGLLIQSYCGEVSGTFNGVAMVKMAGMESPTLPLSRSWIISALIHELINTINIGHHEVSGFEDVYYGIDGTKENPAYDPENNPRPICTSTDHYDPITGKPNPFSYFPDSYHILDPMWNNNPFEPFNENTISYCLSEPHLYPSTNPLNPNDHYEDLIGLMDTCKYYKFLFQCHFQDSFVEKLYTSYCKNCRLDQKRDNHDNFEFDIDIGGGCLKELYQCREDGLCFELSFDANIIEDKINNIPLKNENVLINEDPIKGKVGFFGTDKRILVSGAEYFADSDEFTIEVTVKFDEIGGYQPLVVNVNRYDFYVVKGLFNNTSSITIRLHDTFVPFEVGYKQFEVPVNIQSDRWYTISATLKNGKISFYLNGMEVGSTEEGFFKGRFIYQNTSDYNANVFIGNHPRYRWLYGEIESVKFYNRCIEIEQPILFCPDNITIKAKGPLTKVNYEATVFDPNISLKYEPPSGSEFSTGKTPVIITATDKIGNISQCSFIVDVKDPEIFYVSPGFSIQQAINASSDGDIIIIAEGVYSENINFLGKAITVRSTDPSDPNVIAATIIDGNQIDSVVIFNNGEGNDSELCGVTIQNGYSGSGAGILCNNNSSPTITKCTIKNNITHSGCSGGGIYCGNFSSPIIIECIISNNSAGRDGGGIYCLWYASPTINECIIKNNSVSDYNGGGICCYDYSSPSITNCIISENSVHGLGAGIFCWTSCDLTIKNCTIVKNHALNGNGGGICIGNLSSPSITNCILWNNLPDQIAGPSTITYSDIQQSGYSDPNHHNINQDPLFVDPNADFHLKAGSPCIDVGTNNGAPASDKDGTLRPQDGNNDSILICDMGAYENLPSSSFNFKKELFCESPSLYLMVSNINIDTGEVTVNGVDTNQLILPFTWDWGDGTINDGWFPQSHTYEDANRNYIVKVTSHYSSGTTAFEEILVRFISFSITPSPEVSVTIPDSDVTLTGLFDPNLQEKLTYFNDSFFNVIPRSDIEYLLSIAASIQKDFVNENIPQNFEGFKQVILREPTCQWMYSLWFTNPVSIISGDWAFQGSIPWTYFFLVMSHNFILNTPSNYCYGGKIDGNAYALLTESLANIFVVSTAYEIINNRSQYGLSSDILTEITQNAIIFTRNIRNGYENYIDSGMNFSSWNDPNTPEEAFNTYMTIAYKFCSYAENTGLGYRIPLKRMMEFLQTFDENLSQRYDPLNNSSEADTFRSTYMIAALSYAFSKDLREEFRALNFPISDEIYEILIYGNNATVKFEWKIPEIDNWFLSSAHGIAADKSGNIYVVDTYNCRIKKFSSDGTFIKEWGNLGDGDGQLNWPQGIAVDIAGNIYVTDSSASRIQKFSSDGDFLDKWERYGSGDGEFLFPTGIAIDVSGNIYIADTANNRIQKFSPDGTFLMKFGSMGSGDGEFDYPEGITVDTNGNIYVCDKNNCRIQKFASDGTFLHKWGTYGSGDGKFYSPSGITVDSTGNIYVADEASIQKFSSDGTFIEKLDQGCGQGITIDATGNIYAACWSCVLKYASNGSFLTKWCGERTEDGELDLPTGIAVDANSNIYVVDDRNYCIQKFSSNGIFLDKWGSYGQGDGEFNGVNGIGIDAFGNIYVTESWPNRIQKFAPDGTFLDKWGSEGSEDGQFNNPYWIAVDANNIVYVADSGNNRIQKFASDGTFLDKWGSEGSEDGQFSWPAGIAIDANNIVYVADRGNNRIQKFSSDGIFLDKWGSPGSGDGEFFGPTGIATDINGDIYVTDSGNDRIQKFASDGTFLMKWGSSGSGNGEFDNPEGIATDINGNIYIVDTFNHRIQKFSLVSDSDEDGLTDVIELSTGTDPNNADTDNDGLVDGNNGNIGNEDFNVNGIVDPGETDPRNPDTDGDGIFDGTERGLTEPESEDTDILAGYFLPDADPNTTTDPTDADSDDDGILDGNEDKNHNGRIEPNLGETDPDNPDTDSDGIYDGTETGLTEPQNSEATDLNKGFFISDADPNTTTDPTNPDSDGDGVIDGEEDFNKDGAFNPEQGERNPNIKEIDVEINLPAGWSMISLPVKPNDAILSSLFPGAAVVYGYERESGYMRVQKDEKLGVGYGYWILLDQNHNYTLTGQPFDYYSKAVNDNGWDMIGGCTSSAQVLTNNCDVGVIYGYEPGIGYQQILESEDLEPNKGYWILFKNVIDEAQITIQESIKIESIIVSSSYASTNSQVFYECKTSNTDPNDSLTFEWSVNGEILPDNDANIVWLTPESKGIYTISVIVSDHLGKEDRDSVDITVFEPLAENFLVDPNGKTQWHDEDLGLDFSVEIKDISETEFIDFENLYVAFSINESIFLFQIQDMTDPNLRIVLLGDLKDFSKLNDSKTQDNETILKWVNPETGTQIFFNKGSVNLSASLNKDDNTKSLYLIRNDTTSNKSSEELRNNLRLQGYVKEKIIDGCTIQVETSVEGLKAYYKMFKGEFDAALKWTLEQFIEIMTRKGDIDPYLMSRYEVWTKDFTIPIKQHTFQEDIETIIEIKMHYYINLGIPQGTITPQNEDKEINFGEKLYLKHWITIGDGYCNSLSDIGANYVLSFAFTSQANYWEGTLERRKYVEGSNCEVIKSPCIEDKGDFHFNLNNTPIFFHPPFGYPAEDYNKINTLFVASEWTPTSIGDYELETRVKTYEKYGGYVYTATTRVKVKPPELEIQSPTEVYPGETVRYLTIIPEDTKVKDIIWETPTPEGGSTTNDVVGTFHVVWKVPCLDAGDYTIKAKVILDGDNCEIEIPIEKNITVKEINFSLDIEGRQSVHENEEVSYTALINAPTGIGETYNWSVTGGTILSGQNTPSIIWKAPDVTNGNYTISLAIEHDLYNCYNAQNSFLDVHVGNLAPQVTIDFPDEVHAGDTVVLTINATDPEGDEITGYTWRGYYFQHGPTPDNTFNWTARSYSKDTEITIRGSAIDEFGVESAEVSKKIIVTNKPPQVTIDFPDEVHAGDTVVLTINATDPEGDEITGYTWRGYYFQHGPTPDNTFNWTARSYSKDTEITIRGSAIDEFGAESAEVSKKIIVTNKPPQVTITAPNSGHSGETITVIVNTTDPEGDEINWYACYTSGWGGGSSYESNIFTLVLPSVETETESYISGSAGDIHGATSNTVYHSITITNAPPQVTITAPNSGHSGETITVIINTTDPEGDEINWYACYTSGWGGGSSYESNIFTLVLPSVETETESYISGSAGDIHGATSNTVYHSITILP